MALRIGIISAGSMGAAVGQQIAQNSAFEVFTVVEGRSQATKDRAIKAGFKLYKSLEDLIEHTDILLSILPPGDAVPLAESSLSILGNLPNQGESFTFVDCNAISPATSRKIADLFSQSSKASFVDGSIVGGPPKEGYSPVFYFSGKDDAAVKLEKSFQGSGISVKTLSGGVGAASALKMVSFSADTWLWDRGIMYLTKGLLGLIATSLLGASSNGVLPELLEELAVSNQHALRRVPGAASALPLKSYRWVAEMQEIGAYYTEAGVPEGGELFEGMAKLFERTDKEKDGNAGEVLKRAAQLAKEFEEKESPAQ